MRFNYRGIIFIRAFLVVKENFGTNLFQIEIQNEITHSVT